MLDYLTQSLDNIYVYHNFYHANYVLSKIEELALAEKISDYETEIVILAGWFYDIGYTINKVKHLDFSIQIAKKYLEKNQYDTKKISEILNCINAT